MVIATGNNIATNYTKQERYAEADRLFTHTARLARAVNVPYFLCDSLHNHGNLHARREQWAQALTLQNEALEASAQVGRKDIEFRARVAALVAQVQLGERDPAAAVAQLEAWLAEWPGESEQAALHDEIWRLDATREDARQTAADLYRTLHEQTPNIEYRQHYHDLTRERLPDPPPLPLLSADIVPQPGRLETLIARVDELGAGMVS
jgi:tetratricopeptide (TPR) repeat protein